MKFAFLLLLLVSVYADDDAREGSAVETTSEPVELHCDPIKPPHMHATFPRARARLCAVGDERMTVEGVCLDGYEPKPSSSRASGRKPVAACCFFVSAAEPTWLYDYESACVEIPTTQPITTTRPPTTSTPTRRSPTPTSERPSSSSSANTTSRSPPSTTSAATTRPVTVTPAFVSPIPSLAPYYKEVKWNKSNCMVLIAKKIVFEFQSYSYDSENMGRYWYAPIFKASCPTKTGNHSFTATWRSRERQNVNFTFTAMFSRSNSNWYAYYMSHQDSGLREKFEYNGTYFSTNLAKYYSCGMLIHASNHGQANVTFHGLSLQAYDVSQTKLAANVTKCTGKSSFNVEMTVIIVSVAGGSVLFLIITAVIIIRCSRSEYDFLK